MLLIPKKITWFLGITAIIAFCLSGLLINNYGLVIGGMVFVGLLVVNHFYQPYAYTNRGGEQLRQGNYLKALEDYHQALRLNRHCAPAYYSRGITLFWVNEVQASFEDFHQALQLNPNYYLAYIYRGWVRSTLNEYQGAIEDLNQALQLNPLYQLINKAIENLEK
ncbi:MAG: tetratricopeptide repeat protein [Cyanobacteriota bacterium]